MSKVKKLLAMISLCLSVILVIPIVSPDVPSSVTVEAATKVKLSKSKATLVAGKTLQLKLKGAKGKVSWNSSKKSVATVSKSGKVTAKKQGTATITAKNQGKKYTCKITVKKAVPLKSITLNKSNVTLEVDDYTALKVKYNPSNTTVSKNVKWTSSNEDIADVDDDGYVYANSAGTAIITAKVDGKKASCQVTVTEPVVEVESVSLDKTYLQMYLGQTATLKANILPSNATNKTVTWVSENANVATVDSIGQIKAVGVGSTNIIVKSNNGKTAKCNVTVKVKAVEKIDLSNSTLELNEGETATLTTTVSPSDAYDKTITWSTSNASVATVNNGVVSAVAPGTATITAMAGGKYATCNVTVEESFWSLGSWVVYGNMYELATVEIDDYEFTPNKNDSTKVDLTINYTVTRKTALYSPFKFYFKLYSGITPSTGTNISTGIVIGDGLNAEETVKKNITYTGLTPGKYTIDFVGYNKY